MTSRNDITGDKIQTKITTKEYQNNYDLIFRKDSGFNLEEEIKKETKKQLAAIKQCCGKCSPCSGHDKEDKDASPN